MVILSLESMEWVMKKDKSRKVKPSEKIFQEENLSYQRAILRVALDHDIPLHLVLRLDQTPLSYLSPGRYTLFLRKPTTVSTKGIDDNRQITATFIFSTIFFTNLIGIPR